MRLIVTVVFSKKFFDSQKLAVKANTYPVVWIESEDFQMNSIKKMVIVAPCS